MDVHIEQTDEESIFNLLLDVPEALLGLIIGRPLPSIALMALAIVVMAVAIRQVRTPPEPAD